MSEAIGQKQRCPPFYKEVHCRRALVHFKRVFVHLKHNLVLSEGNWPKATLPAVSYGSSLQMRVGGEGGGPPPTHKFHLRLGIRRYTTNVSLYIPDTTWYISKASGPKKRFPPFRTFVHCRRGLVGDVAPRATNFVCARVSVGTL